MAVPTVRRTEQAARLRPIAGAVPGWRSPTKSSQGVTPQPLGNHGSLLLFALSMRRRRRHLPLSSATLDALALLALGAMGIIGLVYWPEYYLADLAIPIALIILLTTRSRA
jgi:hypothetical protein